jgi:hypothetical protein
LTRARGTRTGRRRELGQDVAVDGAGDGRRQQVADAEEAGDEPRGRPLVEALRDRPAARTWPRFMTAIRSDIVMASS